MKRAENSAANENGIPFFDETSVFTVDEEDGEQVLVRYADKPGGPVCYLSRDKKVIRYYIVTINLDNDTATGIMDLLYEINKKNRTAIIMVTHNQNLLKQYPGRVFLCVDNTCREEVAGAIDLDIEI